MFFVLLSPIIDLEKNALTKLSTFPDEKSERKKPLLCVPIFLVYFSRIQKKSTVERKKKLRTSPINFIDFSFLCGCKVVFFLIVNFICCFFFFCLTKNKHWALVNRKHSATSANDKLQL